jgi:hypothetical protein
MFQSYYNTYHCCEKLEIVITDTGLKTIGKYCGYRWCYTCNRIKTALHINGYSRVLHELGERYFVTLSRQNVPKGKLIKEVGKLHDDLVKIRKCLYKQGVMTMGLRKFEITHNDDKNNDWYNTFHPHFHLIIKGEFESHVLLDTWLKRNPKLSTNWAQNIKQCDENSTVELCKYMTKIFSKTYDGTKRANVKALHHIFTTMKGKRIFQPMGIKKEVPEEITGISAQVLEELFTEPCDLLYNGSDWYSTQTGEALTGYKPDAKMYKMINSIS